VNSPPASAASALPSNCRHNENEFPAHARRVVFEISEGRSAVRRYRICQETPGKHAEASDWHYGSGCSIINGQEPFQKHEKSADPAKPKTNASLAIVSKTLQSIVTSWNPGAEKLFGLRLAHKTRMRRWACQKNRKSARKALRSPRLQYRQAGPG
jgi:hypothetical protein